MAAAIARAACSFTSSSSCRAVKQGAFGVPMGRRCTSLASFPACPSCRPALRCNRYSKGGKRHPTTAKGGMPRRRADNQALQWAALALPHTPSSWGRLSLVIPSPPNFVALTVARHQPAVVECIDEDAAQRVKETASMPLSTRKRRAPASPAMHRPSLDSCPCLLWPIGVATPGEPEAAWELGLWAPCSLSWCLPPPRRLWGFMATL